MELLKQLSMLCAPAGNEGAVRQFLEAQLAPLVDDLSTDVLGNLIAHKKGNGKRLMLSAHMDEVGFLVTVQDAPDRLRVAAIGQPKGESLGSAIVSFGEGNLGVLCAEEGKAVGKGNWNDFYVDVLSPVDNAVGTALTFAPNAAQQGDTLLSKGLGSRGACYVLLQVMRQLQNCPYDVYAVFTVQHQLGQRGAGVAAASVRPDYAITVDSVCCDDVPGGKGSLKLGGGAVIKIKDHSILCHPVLKNKLMEVAQKNNIPVQYQVSAQGDSDSGAIHMAGAGIIAGSVGIPCRYQNTPGEMMRTQDICAAIDLLQKTCEECI